MSEGRYRTIWPLFRFALVLPGLAVFCIPLVLNLLKQIPRRDTAAYLLIDNAPLSLKIAFGIGALCVGCILRFLMIRDSDTPPPQPGVVTVLDDATLTSKVDAIDDLLKHGETPSLAGIHLDVSSCKILKTDAFKNLNLRASNFRGACLIGHQFGWADVADADFSDTDLTNADMSDVINLLPHQLSGADLTSCKLPDEVKGFSQLDNVAELSKNAGRFLSSLIVASVFIALTLFSTPDLQILADSGTAKLPAIELSVQTSVFIVAAPIVLLVLFILEHLYLQRLWTTMAQLPAVFPDGVTVDSKAYPWLVNDRIRTGFKLLKQHPMPLALWHNVGFGFLIFCTTPLALLLVYLRCLIRHDKQVTSWQVACLVVCLGLSVFLFDLNRSTLRRDRRLKDRYVNHGISKFRIGGLVAGLLSAFASLAMLHYFTDAAFNGFPDHLCVDYTAKSAQMRTLSQNPVNGIDGNIRRACYQFVPDLLFHSGLAGYGNIAEDKSVRPEKWDDPVNVFLPLSNSHMATIMGAQCAAYEKKDFLMDKIDEIDMGREDVIFGLRDLAEDRAMQQRDKIDLEVKRTRLRGMTLNFLSASSSFLVNADLRDTDLKFADLKGTDLRGALFSYGAELSGACLNNAFLTGSELPGANLIGANLRNATLTGATLSNANLTEADLSCAILTAATLERATMASAILLKSKLIFSNLAGAILSNANLRFADLNGADLSSTNLTHANLSSSDLRRANLKGAQVKGVIWDMAVFSTSGPNIKPTVWPDDHPPDLQHYRAVSVTKERLDDLHITKPDDIKAAKLYLRMLQKIPAPASPPQDNSTFAPRRQQD